MDQETRNCQNCKKDFVIEPDDFAFYEKIKVPAPTWCPECRMQRRMIVRNEHFLYKAKCGRTGKTMFSMYPSTAKLNVWDYNEWIKDDWNQEEYARDYDFKKTFFEQFKELLQVTPVPSKSVTQPINSDYCNNSSYMKDCYLSFGGTYAENLLYCENSSKSKYCVDSSFLISGEFSYDSFFNQKCSRAFYSSYCADCHSIYFCRECIGCADCFGCFGLRNKSFHIFNEPYSKEEYNKKLEEFKLSSRESINKIKKKVAKFWLDHPVKYARNYKNENCLGEYISNSKNVQKSYYVIGGENLKYCHSLYNSPARDSYDHFRFGLNSELIYDSASCGDQVSNIKFSYGCFNNCRNIEYSFYCNRSSNLFGCVGLYGKEYHILNKQYSKEDYERLVSEIKKHMSEMTYTDHKGRVYAYGEFFPPEISPYSYNESIAHEYFPLTKTQAESYGMTWSEPAEKFYTPTLTSDRIPDSIKEVNSSITSEILECAHSNQRCNHQCITAFKIIPQELDFYKRFNIPLPNICPNCRYFERISQRAPIKLWHRKCNCAGVKSENGVYSNAVKHQHSDAPCPNEFETSYAPDRPEIVYCEQCYQQEIA